MEFLVLQLKEAVGSRESGARVGPAWGPRGTRVGGPAWDPRGTRVGTRVGPAGFRVPKPTCLLCLCFARRHCRIPFGDHPIKLERYRED